MCLMSAADMIFWAIIILLMKKMRYFLCSNGVENYPKIIILQILYPA